MLIRDGRNMAITHELFSRIELSPSLYEQISAYGYTLMLDEVLDVIIPLDITKTDINMLIDTKKISVDEYGNVKWLDADYKGKFEHLKHRADSKT